MLTLVLSMPSTATSVDLVHDTPPKMSIASSARAVAGPRPSVASMNVAIALSALVIMAGSYQRRPPECARLDSYRGGPSKSGQQRRAGGDGSHENEHRGAEPRDQPHEREHDAPERDRLDGRLVPENRHALAEPSRRHREAEEQEGDQQQDRDGNERDADDRHGQQDAERDESEDDGEPTQGRETRPIDEVRLDAGQGTGEGDGDEQRDDVDQHGTGGPREQRSHSHARPAADDPPGGRADRRRDRAAQAHAVAFHSGGRVNRHAAAERDRIALDAGTRQEGDGAADRHRVP